MKQVEWAEQAGEGKIMMNNTLRAKFLADPDSLSGAARARAELLIARDNKKRAKKAHKAGKGPHPNDVSASAELFRKEKGLPSLAPVVPAADAAAKPAKPAAKKKSAKRKKEDDEGGRKRGRAARRRKKEGTASGGAAGVKVEVEATASGDGGDSDDSDDDDGSDDDDSDGSSD
jgi:hypothetical protein